MIDSIKEWYNKPFSEDMDVVGWFYFFGLVIAISVLWGLILRHIVNKAF